jgi:sarcosine oxidase subunit alpha
LNRVYVNGFAKLPVNKCRYGVMLRDDGIVYDDGTTIRLAEEHFLMSATTANAARVLQELEFALQVHWPELRVSVSSTTDLWASMSLAGPKSRAVLEALESDIDVSNEAMPFMGHAAGTIAGIPAHVFRISFSGELGFELACEADHGIALWEAVIAAGEPLGLAPYGTEALGILRIEKGHVVIGPEGACAPPRSPISAIA